jgi:hypothetical protein
MKKFIITGGARQLSGYRNKKEPEGSINMVRLPGNFEAICNGKLFEAL